VSGRKAELGLEWPSVLVCERHCDRVRGDDPILDQYVTQWLSGRPLNRQALVELLLAEQAGADQQLAETGAPVRRFRRRIVR
jgi:hypothetical protein